MNGKQKLELTWIGKDQRPKLEPRILIEEPARSHHAATRREGDIFDNILIHGDNLLALKALGQEYAGRVKCAFMDPPYKPQDDAICLDGDSRSGFKFLIARAIEEKYQLTVTVEAMTLAERIACRRACEIVTHNFLPGA
jgi:hypothetical protein